MTKKRLTRDQKWFFQSFPYYQMHMDNELIQKALKIIFNKCYKASIWHYF